MKWTCNKTYGYWDTHFLWQHMSLEYHYQYHNGIVFKSVTSHASHSWQCTQLNNETVEMS